MFSLENGQQYALSSNPSTADILQLDTKTYVFLKLTDSAYRTIDEYQKNIAKSQKCINKPKIQFTGDTGVIKIPANQTDSRSYKFTLAQVDPSTSSTCIRHNGIRSGCREIETLGTMGHKITVCADDDVYQQTRVKMTLAEEENKKICTKEIKPSAGSKYRAKLNKKISHTAPAPLTKPEIKSSIVERILAQQQQAHAPNTSHFKAADAKPARIAHRPRPAEFSNALPAKPETKPKPDERPPPPPAKHSPEKKSTASLPRHSPSIREESLKRPGPPVEMTVAKKPRCEETELTSDSKASMVDNAASHWKKQPLNQNQNSRNFFSDRLSPDCRPKLAVPPMPAPKPTEPVHDERKDDKREDNMKENHNIGADDQYLRDYTEICTMAQRLRYKQDFNAEYEEYQKLHANISSVSRRFQRMENDLKSAEEGTKMHEKIKKAIVQEYVNYKKDPGYVKDKSRFDHLHKKLSHIKKLIVEYDERQITSQ